MSNPWFRFYSDFIQDDKIEFLSFEDQRHYVFVLCMKNMGLLDKEYPMAGMMEKIIARRLGLQGEAFVAVKIRLQDMGLIDDQWQPTGWDKRQYVSDSSAERVKRHREKRAAAGLVRQQIIHPEQRARIYQRDGHKCIYCGNEHDLTIDHLTPQSRGGDDSDQNLATACRACNASKRDRTFEEFIEHRETLVTANVTLLKRPQNTDSDKETEQKQKKATAVATPEGVSDFVWADFKKLRTAKKAPITQTALDGIAREAAKAGVTLEKALQTCCERGWTGFKSDWVAEQPQVQRGPALPHQTVPSKNTPDPALEKIKADEAVVKPPPPEIRAKLELLKRGGLSAFRQ